MPDTDGSPGQRVHALLDAGRQWLASAGRVQHIPRGAILQWAGIVAAIAVAITLIVQFVVRPSVRPGEETSAQQVTLPAPPEPATVPEDNAPPSAVTPVAPLPDVVLGDSIRLVVVAARDKLDPFRVQVDRDLRRPYWLDQGDTLAFYFAERVTVQDLLDEMTVLLEGRSYPLVPSDTSGRVIISRDSVRAFLAGR